MSDQEFSLVLLAAIVSMIVSMTLIPVMIRLAPSIGMIDKPDPRKVHTIPVPRVGGIGIVIGALIPLLIWLPAGDLKVSLLLGGAVLFLFGVIDDAVELGHYTKFIGQFVAAALVVYHGDLWVGHFPLAGDTLISEHLGKPFTVIAIVGMINAINHSDGLDGLAGGEALISLCGICYLAFQYDDIVLLIIVLSTAGGIFGFLRYNTHPARVFMGDGGSQFIGYMLGVAAVYLTQETNPVLSPGIALLILGLPIADILAVFFLRAKGGMNLFKASRNHIHHRLLELGLQHYQSVIVIYSIQAGLVTAGVMLTYEHDELLLGLYLLVIAAVFTGLTFVERNEMRLPGRSMLDDITNKRPAWLKRLFSLPVKFVDAGVSLFLVGGALMAESAPLDFGVAAIILLVLLLVFYVLDLSLLTPFRLVAYVTSGFIVYLVSNYPPGWLSNELLIVYLYFGILAAATFIAVRLLSKDIFEGSPMDYLVFIMVLLIVLVQETATRSNSLIAMGMQIIILFYAIEMLILKGGTMKNHLTSSIGVALSVIAVRSFI